jgi:porin-like protein
MKRIPNLAIAALCAALAIPAAEAQTADSNLHIHGFGDWIYGKSDGNDYQSASEEGRYDDAAFGLNIRYDASDRVAVVSQIAWEHAEGRAADAETLLDYAFVQWTKSDRLHLRVGRTYHPFGLYSEIRDIGTARPFIERPPEVYGQLGIVSESLQGLNAYGDLPAAKNWGLHYDLYAGATELPVIEAGSEEAEETVEKIRDVIGGRLTVDTPLSGFRASVSAFRGVLKQEQEADENHVSMVASIDYVAERWLVRAEAARHKEDTESVSGAYVEGSYRVHGPWQLTGRWGTTRTKFDDDHVASRFRHQRDVAAGVNLWLDPRVVLKTEIRFVNGNRFAVSNPIEESKDKTRVFQAAVQFSF